MIGGTDGSAAARGDMMGKYVLTSNFERGFPQEIAKKLGRLITKRDRFAFVASEFKSMHEKTDKYFRRFLDFFADAGITFADARVVDGRPSPEQARQTVAEADVVWLSGGDTLAQFGYLTEYGLVDVLRRFDGVLIGMSAGSINMAKTAILTSDPPHTYELHIYDGIGCVDFSVEPHFDPSSVPPELFALADTHRIYGLCDDGAIFVSDGKPEFVGDVYTIENGVLRGMKREFAVGSEKG